MEKNKKGNLTDVFTGVGAGMASAVAGQIPLSRQMSKGRGIVRGDDVKELSDKELKSSFKNLKSVITPNSKTELIIGEYANMRGPHARPSAISEDLLDRITEGNSKRNLKAFIAAYKNKHMDRGTTIGIPKKHSIWRGTDARSSETIAHELGHAAQLDSKAWRRVMRPSLIALNPIVGLTGTVGAGVVGSKLKGEENKKKRHTLAAGAAGLGAVTTAHEWDADRRAVKGLHKTDHYGYGKGVKGYLKTLGRYAKYRIPGAATYLGMASAPAVAILAAGTGKEKVAAYIQMKVREGDPNLKVIKTKKKKKRVKSS